LDLAIAFSALSVTSEYPNLIGGFDAYSFQRVEEVVSCQSAA
jgi:hypothetical protein